jgi:glutaminase
VGNSVRAIAACKEMAEQFGLHVFRTPPSSGTTIRGRLSGVEARSKRVRNPGDQAILAAHGSSIRLIEIQGALFFGSTERVVREVSAVPDDADYIILDIRRVSVADKAACALFQRLCDDLAARGKRLLVAHLHAAGPLANLHAALNAQTSSVIFADRDAALEFAENEILAARRTFVPGERHELQDVELFAGLSAKDLKIVGRVAREVTFQTGDLILKEGEIAGDFYVLASGAASVRQSLPGETATRSIRIATLGPGATTGEMALLDGGKRSADVVADQLTRCHVFSVDALRKALKNRQEGLNIIYANLARSLSERLRAVNREIRALEQ